MFLFVVCYVTVKLGLVGYVMLCCGSVCYGFHLPLGGKS